MMNLQLFHDRRGVWAFGLGCLAVTIGVLLHIPMFWMGHGNGFVFAGMPMDKSMIFGMYLIIAGVGIAGYGLLPTKAAHRAQAALRISVTAPEDAKLGRAHWTLMAALTVALVIDVLKPATLGFVLPGMMNEYKASYAYVSARKRAGWVSGNWKPHRSAPPRSSRRRHSKASRMGARRSDHFSPRPGTVSALLLWEL